jgi:sporulation protein YlmC with PRC-barrel domain
VSQSQTSQQQQQGKLFRVTQLMGVNAKSKDGQSLGEIEDLVINPQNQRIKFAVLGKGGFLGVGEKMLPVPWEAVTVQKSAAGGQAGKPDLTVNIDQQKMKTAPTMQKDKQYSELDQPDYIITIYRFYEITPVGAGGTGQGTETESSSQQKSRTEQQNK